MTISLCTPLIYQKSRYHQKRLVVKLQVVQLSDAMEKSKKGRKPEDL